MLHERVPIIESIVLVRGFASHGRFKRVLGYIGAPSLLLNCAEKVKGFCLAFRVRKRSEHLRCTVVFTRLKISDREIVVNIPGLRGGFAYPFQDWNCAGSVAMLRQKRGDLQQPWIAILQQALQLLNGPASVRRSGQYYLGSQNAH